jgi:CubicO group peptidase (beta-lactamase class C family)
LTTCIKPKDVFGVNPKKFNYEKDKDKMFIPLEKKICKSQRFPFSKSPEMTYHAVTRGWLVNGIVRRVDPCRRSLAQFIREEITDKLSKVGDEGDRGVKAFCGIQPGEQEKLKFAGMSRPSIVSLTKLAREEKTVAETIKLVFRPNIFRYLNHISWSVCLTDYVDSIEGRQMECSSGHMFANARSIAKVNAAAMAGDGSLDGISLLKPDGVSNSMGSVKDLVDTTLNTKVSLSQGGYGDFGRSAKNDGTKLTRMFSPEDEIAYGNFMGWGGAGGSLSLVDRERDISFAYCMNAMHPNLIGGVRTRRILLALQAALSPCP